jgi:hypothetical protein
MRSRFYRKLIQFGLFPFVSVVLLLGLLTGSFGQGNARAQPDWKPASQSAPPGLLEQVVQENIQPGISIDAQNMKIWTIHPSQAKQALYLIDPRVAKAEDSSDNPLCGAAGCVFLAYVQVSGNLYQRVLNTYLNPLLPPEVPLIKPGPELQSGLPCLQVNQLERQKIRTFKLCVNGTTYEVMESHLLPKVYE